MNVKELKFAGGKVREVKQEERNGQAVGIVAGYIATWDVDRGSYGIRDQFVRGAFVESLRQHQNQNRPVRLKDQHGKTVGGFPIENIYEDEVGVFAIGEINLEVVRGREIMALAKQGVLSDFSVGFSVIEFTEDEGLRKITKAVLWEASVVDEPMNPKAKIIDVKSLPFQNLPIADADYEWNPFAAQKRVDLHPEYSKAFIGDLLVADLIDDEITVIPAALFKAAESGKNIQHIERYYAKMNLPSPFDADKREYFTAEDIKEWTPRMFEKALKKSGMFSSKAAKILAGEFDKPPVNDDNDQELVDFIKSIEF